VIARFLADIGDGQPTVLALNQIDRVAQKDRLLPLLPSSASSANFAAIVPISALAGDGVDASSMKRASFCRSPLPASTPIR